MKPKIVIAGFSRFSELARKTLVGMNIPDWIEIEITEIPLRVLDQQNDAKDYLRSLFDPATILISGDRSSISLKEKINNLVIPVKVTGFDFLETLQQINSKDITVLHFYKNINEISNISDMLTININQKSFSSYIEGIDILKNLQEKGIKEVVGGSWVCDQAEEFGMNGIFYYSKRAMTDAINNALNVLIAYRKELEKTISFKTIVEMHRNGIIATDKSQKIELVSPSAEQLLGIKKKYLIGKVLNTVIPQLTFSPKDHEYNFIFEHNNKKLVADIAPIILDGDHFGSIIAFEDIATIQETELNIRKKINNKPLEARYYFEDIFGSSKTLEKTVQWARKFSMTNSSILIQGESGTGKELFAQSIHNASKRSRQSFVAINCAALPENLLDSELFGYEEGAFTGAKKGGKVGLFELAHKGTIFLDEISELPLHLQSRLLRVLQEKEVLRVGGNQVIPVDVRIIAASNKNLERCVDENTFRGDLFYRIGVLQLHIPPLRDRTEDIEEFLCTLIEEDHFILTNSFLRKDILHLLKSYSWPGNIRELENVMERFNVFSKNNMRNHDEILSLMKHAIYPYNTIQDKKEEVPIKLKDNEMVLINETLQRFHGNKEKAAKELGISRSTLWRKLKK